jgi:hypothetical protein
MRDSYSFPAIGSFDELRESVFGFEHFDFIHKTSQTPLLTF